MKIETIVQVISSIATTVAVIVSLWQSGYSNQKKVKAEACCMKNIISCEVSNRSSKIQEIGAAIRIEVTNVGRYDIVIKKVYLKRSRGLFWALDYYLSELNPETKISFPFKLVVGEYERFYVNILFNDEFKKVEKKDKILMIDSSNKKYVCKLER